VIKVIAKIGIILSVIQRVPKALGYEMAGNTCNNVRSD
jgi:hypothetical protein